MQRTNFRFEAIVHDDASTDGIADIIIEYAEKYPYIIKPIYEQDNQYSKHNGFEFIWRLINKSCTKKLLPYVKVMIIGQIHKNYKYKSILRKAILIIRCIDIGQLQ